MMNVQKVSDNITLQWICKSYTTIITIKKL